MSNITIKENNNVYSDGSYIGSICYKSYGGHWTAYLATTTGDEVIGQYKTDVLAAEAVGEAANG
ncbi:hypothetical protein Lepto7375DRAFT_7423 [Leptolyngbya sp. PCC 7375]|nr:hypothetical protein Lepto7375DRAFT_0609 [Leptolyngbya sp. PCC 7375]EKU98162.1 hypothetical protein Lepto7375DRAFT_7423 [Leptolyngbya sp. PCC 7375]